MTRTDTPYASDDEFDVVDATDAQVPASPAPAAVTSQATDLDAPPVGRLPLGSPPVPEKVHIDKIDEISRGLSKSKLDAHRDQDVSKNVWSHDATQASSSKDDSYRSRVTNSIRSFTGIDWSSKDILIAIMGMTGSGKTTFISKVTGRTDLKIGHDLTSCTQDIEVIETTIGGKTVRFVDTPGFSDTYLSDTDILTRIADYLAIAFKEDTKLSGIIYLQPISDIRMTHHSTKNLEMFKKLTGDKNLKNVVLATTMWDKVQPAEGIRREKELEAKFWSILIAYGAKTFRYEGTRESARSLAKIIMKNNPFYLKLQQELCEENKPLNQTSAGRAIMEEIAAMKIQHQREIAEVKEMVLKASQEENKAAVDALQNHYEGLLRDMEKTMHDERKMNEENIRSLAERINSLESRSPCAII